MINIDDYINYKAEYSAYVKKAEISGGKLIGLCPFHSDEKYSFSVDLKTGQWYCFAEGEGGNFLDFYAKINGVDTKTAYKNLLEKYGIKESREESTKKGQNESYSLSQYAFDKHLPEQFLTKNFALSEGRDRDGTKYLKMPYYTKEKKEATYRKRYANKNFKWKYGSTGKICLYNEWNIEQIRQQGYCILVEGESDTQTLTYLNIPALGVAGASMFKPSHVESLIGLKVYIHKEPDKGGETFFNKIASVLKEAEFLGEVYVFSCGAYGAKDPSELYLKNNTGAKEVIKKALNEAEQVDLSADSTLNVIEGQPLGLAQPYGWSYSEGGIFTLDLKTLEPKLVCRTPILITKRLHSLETGEEKVEISFKRDSKWHSAVYPRSIIFTARGITVLADLGCTVTSENAKFVVRFLAALEADNIERIPKVDSAGTYGWQPGNRFIPGHDEGIVLDMQTGKESAYTTCGDYPKWKNLIDKHRENDKFRFIVAGAFTAPLLKIIKQRIFFVYNWGGSKGGKTAALKAALSVWGEPEKLMTNFNATLVGLERTAAFHCDLPLAIDERQLAGSGQQNSLEKVIYMIASGQGKIRGSKNGGLQQLQQWRTVAIATGEEPISNSSSQTGVSTRTIEIYGGPFEDESEASYMHQATALHYGFAGVDFINKIIELGDKRICELYELMHESIQAASGGKSSSHIAGIAAVALGDFLADSIIFKDIEPCVECESWQRALKMGLSILSMQMDNKEADVNENATQFIVDFINSNVGNFGANNYGTCYGYIEGDIAYIFPSILNNALEKGGFSPRKTMRYLAEKGIITIENKKYSVVKRFGGRACRFVEFNMGNIGLQDQLEFKIVEGGNSLDIPFDVTPNVTPKQMNINDVKS